MELIDKLFLTFGLISIIGLFSIKVTDKVHPIWLEYVEVIAVLVGLAGFLITAFCKIWF